MERMRIIGIVAADLTTVFIILALGNHISELLDESQNTTFPDSYI